MLKCLRGSKSVFFRQSPDSMYLLNKPKISLHKILQEKLSILCTICIGTNVINTNDTNIYL